MRQFYRLHRIFVEDSLEKNSNISLNAQQIHYILHVMRMKKGQDLLIFNGRDGEWRAEIEELEKRRVTVKLLEQTRSQPQPLDLTFCFAPLKQTRLDYMVQKSVELGAAVLQPVLTQHTQSHHVHLNKMRVHALEACEQCGNLVIPDCYDAISFEQLLNDWDHDKNLIFCDETKSHISPLPILTQLPKKGLGVLIGPEGGFSDKERKQLQTQPFVVPIGLGPRVLRADTAAVAALSLIGATLGDWSF